MVPRTEGKRSLRNYLEKRKEPLGCCFVSYLLVVASSSYTPVIEILLVVAFIYCFAHFFLVPSFERNLIDSTKRNQPERSHPPVLK
eukprot:g71439.t1